MISNKATEYLDLYGPRKKGIKRGDIIAPNFDICDLNHVLALSRIAVEYSEIICHPCGLSNIALLECFEKFQHTVNRLEE